MNEIATATVRNMARHFIVWGIIITGLMFAGMEGKQGFRDWDRVPASGSFEDVANNNTCEPTVVGEIPSAVIVREVGGGHSYSTNDKMIGKALDEEFAGKDWARFEVRRFCR